MLHPEIFSRCASSLRRIVSSEDRPVQGFQLVFGESASSSPPAAAALPLPVLDGPDRRRFDTFSGTWMERKGFRCWENENGDIWGFTASPDDAGDLEAHSRRIYTRLFELTADRHLYRLWNLVPSINRETGGLENYRRFCIGRSEAFGKAFGDTAARHMPAGSAVGIARPALVVAFYAGRRMPRHFENPLQVPAYEYPRQYGPRAPSFARGTVIERDTGRDVLISGTAAVRGHRSDAVDDLHGQMATTVEMLERMGDEMGVGPRLGFKAAAQRQFIVYLRRPEHLEAVKRRLDGYLFQPGDLVTYTRADICRQELLIEIEASMRVG